MKICLCQVLHSNDNINKHRDLNTTKHMMNVDVVHHKIWKLIYKQNNVANI